MIWFSLAPPKDLQEGGGGTTSPLATGFLIERSLHTERTRRLIASNRDVIFTGIPTGHWGSLLGGGKESVRSGNSGSHSLTQVKGDSECKACLITLETLGADAAFLHSLPHQEEGFGECLGASRKKTQDESALTSWGKNERVWVSGVFLEFPV